MKNTTPKGNILFPYLEKKGFEGPATVMWGVDNEIRAQIKMFKESILDPEPDVIEATKYFETMSDNIVEMVYKEEKILFPAALDRLTEQEWAEIRNQEAEIGFVGVEVGDEWQAQAEAIVAEPEASPATDPSDLAEELVSLSTGALTREQINLLLPISVDVTWWMSDRVRYFPRA